MQIIVSALFYWKGECEMSDLRDKNIISEYLVYADENYNKLRGNANFY